MIYEYLISYSFQVKRDADVGSGRVFVSFDKEIDCQDDLLEVERSIEKNSKFYNVAITNFQFLNKKRGKK